MKRVWIVILLIAIVGSAFAAWRWKTKNSASEKKYEWLKAQKSNIASSVDATGSVTSSLDVEIKGKASGEITLLPFKISDNVKEGDLLAQLDPVDEQRALSRSEIATSATLAKLSQAKLDLELAERTLETDRQRASSALAAAISTSNDRRQKAVRARELFGRQLASRQEVEEAEANAASSASEESGAKIKIKELDAQELNIKRQREAVLLAQTDYESQKLSLLDARQRLKETRIYAPIAGVLSALNVQKGQIISSAISNVGGGTALMVVSDLSRIYVLASIDESDIGRIRVGQEVRITTDGFPAETFTGAVDTIAVKGESVSNVVTFETKIEVTSPNKALLKPEMTANVSIVLEKRNGVTAVPADALIIENGKNFVEVRGANNPPERRQVEVGLTDGQNTEVTSGLSEGDEVVRQGAITSSWQTSSKKTNSGPPPPPM